MKRLRMTAIALIFALVPVTSLSQGRGGGGQGGGQRQGPPPAPMGQPQGPAAQPSKGSGQGTMQQDQNRDQTRQRLQTHATDQQRDRFRTQTQDMDRLRTQSRDMRRTAESKDFSVENARQQQTQLREQFQVMQQEHQRLMNGLDNDQKAEAQNRIRNMDQVQSRINNRLQQMDQELGAATPDQSRIREHARNIDREMERLQKENRAMGDDLSLRGAQTSTQARGQQGAGAGRGDMDRDRTRQRLLTHATDQQRDQFRTTTQDMDRLRTHARDMVNATGNGFNTQGARQLHTRLQEQFQTAQQQHQRLMNGLDPEQRTAMQERVRNMEQIQSRISTRLQEMNRELSSDNPDRQRIQEHSRYIEREMERWQNENRFMGEDLNLSQG